MFTKLFNIIFVFISLLFICYLVLPSPQFPEPIPDSPQSQEPGDTIDLTRKRAYFSNNDRLIITNHYYQQFQIPNFSFIKPIRLNYPPEEADWHIDPHTRSSYLEEYVFPLRESIFVNGYQPKDNEDQIAFEGTPYMTKVTVRYVQSNVMIRVVLGVGVIIISYITIRYWINLLIRVLKLLKS